MAVGTIEWDMALRAMPGEELCGDTGFVEQVDRQVFVALMDAAGHGSAAYESSSRAYAFLKTHCRDTELDDLLIALHHHMVKYRGIVAAFCWLNLGDGTMSHVGIGNIVTRIYGAGGHEFINNSGLIGSSISPQRPRVERHRLHHRDLLVLHSDGISSRARVSQVAGLVDASVNDVASRMVADYGKESDDASCLALRYSVE